MQHDERSHLTVARARGVSVALPGSGPVLTDVDLDLRAGSVLALLGPNGAGKSTLMRTLVGLLRPSSGRWELSVPRRDIGVLIEDPAVNSWQTVESQLTWVCDQIGAGREVVEPVLDRLGLAAVRRRRVSRLSHGMRQRLGIGCALVGDPALVVLDEPFNGLDPTQVDELVAVLRQLAADGVGVLVSTHALHVARSCADECVVLVSGRVVERRWTADLDTDTLEQVYRHAVGGAA